MRVRRRPLHIRVFGRRAAGGGTLAAGAYCLSAVPTAAARARCTRAPGRRQERVRRG